MKNKWFKILIIGVTLTLMGCSVTNSIDGVSDSIQKVALVQFSFDKNMGYLKVDGKGKFYHADDSDAFERSRPLNELELGYYQQMGTQFITALKQSNRFEVIDEREVVDSKSYQSLIVSNSDQQLPVLPYENKVIPFESVPKICEDLGVDAVVFVGVKLYFGEAFRLFGGANKFIEVQFDFDMVDNQGQLVLDFDGGIEGTIFSNGMRIPRPYLDTELSEHIKQTIKRALNSFQQYFTQS